MSPQYEVIYVNIEHKKEEIRDHSNILNKVKRVTLRNDPKVHVGDRFTVYKTFLFKMGVCQTAYIKCDKNLSKTRL